jgi:hypothetical protein
LKRKIPQNTFSIHLMQTLKTSNSTSLFLKYFYNAQIIELVFTHKNNFRKNKKRRKFAMRKFRKFARVFKSRVIGVNISRIWNSRKVNICLFILLSLPLLFFPRKFFRRAYSGIKGSRIHASKTRKGKALGTRTTLS